LKKLLVAALLGFVLMTWGSVPLLAQDEIIIHFSGFGLEEGGFDWSEPGDALLLITHVTSIQGPPGLPYYPDDYEYTLVVSGLVSNGEVADTGYSTIVYNLGLMEIYEDSSFNSDFGEYVDIDTPPSTFLDGTLWLSGPFYQFSMVLFRDYAMGNFDGELTLDSGTAMGAFEEEAYIFGGYVVPPHNPGIPAGYDMSIDGEVWGSSTPTEDATFSKIKALY
jgi:hypothetical protein